MEELFPWLAECYALVDFSGMRSFPHDHIIDMEGTFPFSMDMGIQL
jgi:hypothetical protein